MNNNNYYDYDDYSEHKEEGKKEKVLWDCAKAKPGQYDDSVNEENEYYNEYYNEYDNYDNSSGYNNNKYDYNRNNSSQQTQLVNSNTSSSTDSINPYIRNFNQVCRYFAAKGWCRKGAQCPYKHIKQ
jgi:hypothetical protein